MYFNVFFEFQEVRGGVAYHPLIHTYTHSNHLIGVPKAHKFYAHSKSTYFFINDIARHHNQWRVPTFSSVLIFLHAPRGCSLSLLHSLQGKVAWSMSINISDHQICLKNSIKSSTSIHSTNIHSYILFSSCTFAISNIEGSLYYDRKLVFIGILQQEI